MRLRLITLFTCALACALPAATAASKRSGCYPRHSRTVRENRQARLFVIKHDRFAFSYYGCLFRVGRPRPLRDNPYDWMTGRRLAGHFVAYTWYEQSSQFTVEFLALFDIRSGRTTDVDSASTGRDEAGDIWRFLPTRYGAVVWGIDKQGPGGASHELFKRDRDGTATLDSGSGVGSVRLSPDQRRVLWRNGDEERSAPLR
jgi:hypothetical protein